jgi:hypothetical protein
MSVGNVLIITAYVLTFALIESLIILGLMLLFSLVLPEKRYKDNFIAQSSVVITLMGVGAYMLQRNVNFIYDLQFHELGIFSLVILTSILVLIVVLSFVFERFKKVTRLVNAFAEWMSIFGYIYIPLSLLSLVIVIFRNVF